VVEGVEPPTCKDYYLLFNYLYALIGVGDTTTRILHHNAIFTIVITPKIMLLTEIMMVISSLAEESIILTVITIIAFTVLIYILSNFIRFLKG
jgi:hypothetical protein